VRAPRPRPVTDAAGRPSQDRRSPRIRPTGRLLAAPGTSVAHGDGVELRFSVEVEGGLRITSRAFAQRVERILFHRWGWTRAGFAFRRVPSEPVHFRVVLASPAMTDRLCAPALTLGSYSCHNAGTVVINSWRWANGAASYAGDLARYRTYVVNHEVGHALGRGHLACPGGGMPAPVMMQQTKGVGACTANPWPLPYERG
jgi:hypothetical protein